MTDNSLTLECMFTVDDACKNNSNGDNSSCVMEKSTVTTVVIMATVVAAVAIDNISGDNCGGTGR